MIRHGRGERQRCPPGGGGDRRRHHGVGDDPQPGGRGREHAGVGRVIIGDRSAGRRRCWPRSLASGTPPWPPGTAARTSAPPAWPWPAEARQVSPPLRTIAAGEIPCTPHLRRPLLLP